MRRREPRTACRPLVPVALATLALVAVTGPAGPAVAAGPVPVPALQLVTLTGPGTSAGPTAGAGTPAERAVLLARQDAVLAAVADVEPVYRWTAALNGFAAALTPEQVAALEADPAVATIEANSVRRMAGETSGSLAVPPDAGRARGGAGVVIGVVDSGIAPDSPVFAEVPGLGRDPQRYAGGCAPGEGWLPTTCNRKLVGAAWFVSGFGPDRIRSSESLSARDDVGHGTQVASVAAGNGGVTVRVSDRNAGQFSGIAPQARVAAYKACWAAPDPADDGCSTADLVSAIDRATADGVDVISLAVAGAEGLDTVERALLGAAEADVVVVGAAGNPGRSSYAAHPAPWVTTVGASRGHAQRAAASILGGPRLEGAGRSRRTLGPVRLVLARDVAATAASVPDARQCRPGSLDATRVGGTVVVCERGGIGRIDKSAAVEQADGVGMVLVNVRRGAVTDDFHSVPTVHLAQGEGARLHRWLRHHPRTRVRLAPARAEARTHAVAGWSPAGDPRALVLKPDVVALGDGVLGAIPAVAGRAWGQFSGTSAATARTSGLAALLRSRHDWSAAVVRSVLTTTATPLPGASTLAQGAGEVGRDVPRPGLALEVGRRAWRRALDTHQWRELNLPTLLLRGHGTLHRRITNIGSRAEYFSVATEGFVRHQVRITPVAVRLAPGESVRFRIGIDGPGAPAGVDDGWIRWTGARGSVTRIPVALTR